MKKITIRIDGIEDDWEKLKKLVPDSREFIRKCIIEKAMQKYQLSELKKKR